MRDIKIKVINKDTGGVYAIEYLSPNCEWKHTTYFNRIEQDQNGIFDRYKYGLSSANIGRLRFTGLKDKNGKEGYFDSDIWEIKDYDYSVIVSKDRLGNPSMRQTKKIDLRFILKQGLLEVECEIINKPEDLRKVSLAVLFNLKRKDGTRLFVDEYRKRLEIIGNKFENPELLNN